MKAAFLPDRGVVKVSGDDARNFLNGLVTTDVMQVHPGLGRFGALLTPQGKIIVDFLITEALAGHGGGLLLDCPRALAQTFADKLGFYRLRAKVMVENCKVLACLPPGMAIPWSRRTSPLPIRATRGLAGGCLFRRSWRKKLPI